VPPRPASRISSTKYVEGIDIIVGGPKSRHRSQTPKEVIWTKNKAKPYQSESEEKHRVPIAIYA